MLQTEYLYLSKLMCLNLPACGGDNGGGVEGEGPSRNMYKGHMDKGKGGVGG